MALDSRTGQQIWISDMPALGIYRLTDVGRSVHVAGWAEYSHCVFGKRNFHLDAAGRLLSERSPTSRVAAPPVRDGDTTYVAAYKSPNIVVSARDRVTHDVRWSIDLTASDLPDLNAGSGVLVVTQPGGAGFSVLDGTDGKLLWSVTKRDARAVAGGGDHRVYVIEPGRIVARDSDSGATRWRVSAPDRTHPDVPVVVASSPARVVVAQGNRLIVYDQDGRKVARARLPGTPAGGAFLAGDRLYVAFAGKPSRGSCD
jgi:outer membrane protein assembly factor BamB